MTNTVSPAGQPAELSSLLLMEPDPERLKLIQEYIAFAIAAFDGTALNFDRERSSDSKIYWKGSAQPANHPGIKLARDISVEFDRRAITLDIETSTGRHLRLAEPLLISTQNKPANATVESQALQTLLRLDALHKNAYCSLSLYEQTEAIPRTYDQVKRIFAAMIRQHPEYQSIRSWTLQIRAASPYLVGYSGSTRSHVSLYDGSTQVARLTEETYSFLVSQLPAAVQMKQEQDVGDRNISLYLETYRHALGGKIEITTIDEMKALRSIPNPNGPFFQNDQSIR